MQNIPNKLKSSAYVTSVIVVVFLVWPIYELSGARIKKFRGQI